MQRRAGVRLLDIGSGTGHWIDFFREVYFVADAYAVEITSSMAAFLRDKYAGDPAVRVIEQDVCDPAFALDAPVDYVSAIGVMFHITDDDRWRRALANLRDALKPGGLMFVGGDFGGRTANMQFHRSDSFSTWKEFASAPGAEGEVRVARRLRSLALWSRTAADLGLRIGDLVRADREPGITTPENDLLSWSGSPRPGTRAQRAEGAGPEGG